MNLFDFDEYGEKPKPIPSGQLMIVDDDGNHQPHNLDQYIEDRKVIVVGIPGAFTPTCTEKHLPGFIRAEEDLYNRRVDEIICMSVNDPWVMMAYDDYMNHEGSDITMAADPFGEVAEQLGLLTDMGVLGQRCKRFAAICDKGKIVKMFVDEKGLDQSSAENCLKYL
jgi:peroxiredoxin